MNTILTETAFPSGQKFQLVQGDITTETTDAIVNAANEYLQHGGGVAGVISRRGGDVIQQESDAWVRTHGLVSHAEPAWTSGGTLPCRYVIHAVGPEWGEGDEASPQTSSRADAKLAAAVTGSLRVADELGLESIAFPAISTGIFGFPKVRAAGIMLKSIREYFEKETSTLKTIRLVLFDKSTIDAFLGVWKMENG